MAKTPKKFKVIEKDAKDAPVKDIEWEGEEIGAESTTKIEEDTGTGKEMILRFFEFSANPEAFKQYKPTAQELFGSHQRGIESLLWSDGWQPFTDVEPRLQFTKDNKKYRFIVACIPMKGQRVLETPKTLSQLLK